MNAVNSTIAICYTVKNESKLLQRAIRYHTAIGCCGFYVFIDGTTDDTVATIKGFQNVQIFETKKPVVDKNTPKWISDILPWWEKDMDVRKRINSWHAVQLANRDGVKWLACIDPDELIAPNVNSKISKELLPEFLASIPEQTDQILMRNLETIPGGPESDNPFFDCTIFLNRFPKTETIWRYSSALVRRIFRSPELQAWHDYWFYRIRFQSALPRLMIHPISGVKIPASYFLGYSNHKSIIRTSMAKKYNFVIHYWKRAETISPKNQYAGLVLHYDLFDYHYFASKFRQRSSGIILKIFYCRYMLASVARDSSLAQVKVFFNRYIAISDQNKLDVLEKKGITSKILFISEFFTNDANQLSQRESDC